MVDAGIDVTLASPAGGQPPLDPKSAQPDFQTEFTRRLDGDSRAKEKLAHTQKLTTMQADDFDALFTPVATNLWDLTDSSSSIALIESFQAGKPVAAVCHAPCVLLHAFDAEAPLVQGKKVTGFSDTEEEAVGLTNVVPFCWKMS